MNHYYIVVSQSSPSEMTDAEQATVSLAILVVLIFIIAVIIAGFEIPDKLDERKRRRDRDEQQVLCAIANASEKSADTFQPGATIADLVVMTNLPVTRIADIVRQFRRKEIVREGQNENGNKIYFV